MSRYNYEVFPTTTALARAAAQRFVACAREAVAHGGAFHVALAGGSTPRALYTLLAAPPACEQVDWSRVHVFFGDERSVPPEHAESNYRMACETLLDHVPIPADQVHRVQGELADSHEAAQRYAEELNTLPTTDTGWPRFDLILLGMGDDGHTASLFPGTAILEEHRAPVAAVYVEKLATWRISLTLPVLNAAARVLLLVSGAGKRRVLTEVMQSSAALSDYPVSYLTPRPEVEWLLDAEAAGVLAVDSGEAAP